MVESRWFPLPVPSRKLSGSEKQQDNRENRALLAVAALCVAGVGAYVNIKKYQQEERAATVSVGPSVGTLSLGGIFELLDQNKKVCRPFFNIKRLKRLSI